MYRKQEVHLTYYNSIYGNCYLRPYPQLNMHRMTYVDLVYGNGCCSKELRYASTERGTTYDSMYGNVFYAKELRYATERGTTYDSMYGNGFYAKELRYTSTNRGTIYKSIYLFHGNSYVPHKKKKGKKRMCYSYILECA